MPQPIADILIIAAYDSRWPSLFEEEKVRIAEALGDLAADIQHVGSTAVAGLAAKPIIDIMVAIQNVRMIESITPLVNLGYVCLGEFGIPGRIYYRRNTEIEGLGLSHGGVTRTHHLHTFPANHAEWDRHIHFRDYLRSQPETAREYESLKRDLATQFPTDMEAYTDAKTEFIRGIERAALARSPSPHSRKRGASAIIR